MTDQPAASLTSATLDERALVARLKAGDPDAYEQLVRTLGGRLLIVARRFLRDDDAAADAVQDAFLNAFRAMARFDGSAQLGTWMHRIVVNTCLMRLRSRQRKPEQSLDPLLPCFAEDGHHAEPVASWAESAEHQVHREELRQIVWAALDELPASHRAVIVMRDMEGLSTGEAAAALGVSDNALKLRLHRARQALGAIIRQRLHAPAARTTTRPRAREGSRPQVPAAAGRGSASTQSGAVKAPRATSPVWSEASTSRHAAL
jgi:RNA polymerase sigma-70 factor (ECF subfamily)